jgi:hypothetical protein
MRFEYYASLVRVFSFTEEEVRWTSFPLQWAESLILRSFLGLRKELLPMLKSLEWKAVTSSSIFVGLPHFVTCNLSSLSVTFLSNDASKALPSLAEFLEPNPPPLDNLDLILRFRASSKSRTFFETAHDVERIIRMFPRVSRLRTDARMLAYGVKSLPVFQNLREILVNAYVVWTDTPEYNEDLLLRSKDISFPRLEFVYSQELAWGCLDSLLGHSGNTVLGFTYSQPEIMDLHWYYRHSQLIGTFKAMGERFVNLTTLALQNFLIDENDVNADLTGSLLPFLQCICLQEFDILAEARFVRFISDDDIAQMAAAWPQLKKFVIRYTDFEWSTTDATEASDVVPFTFLSISSLIQHCPLLRTLSLSIKPDDDLVPHNRSQYEGAFRLDELDLGHSLITNEDAFAPLIRDLCPAHRIVWNNKRKLAGLREMLGALQLETQTQRAEELHRRVEHLVGEMEELRRRHDTVVASDIQKQTLIECLRAEIEALRSRTPNA